VDGKSVIGKLGLHNRNGALKGNSSAGPLSVNCHFPSPAVAKDRVCRQEKFFFKLIILKQ
jgi:hypothetical protein